MVGVAGCRNEKAGPSISDYEASKPKILAKAREGHRPQEAQQAAAPAAEVSPVVMAQATVEATYTYDPTDKRDPFRSFILDQASELAAKDAGPLEQFDISQLAVVAVVWDLGDPRALVSDPSGRPYVVGEGTRLGKNEGRVIKIDDNLVLVKETYVDWLGERTTKDIEMRMHGEDKGGDLR
jgi:Tfp pilus assembly protein PilP